MAVKPLFISIDEISKLENITYNSASRLKRKIRKRGRISYKEYADFREQNVKLVLECCGID